MGTTAANENDTYHNPVIFADYSDPDAIRVGSDYWLTSSSFCHVPGLPILHSRDLINWTLINHALPRLVPAEHFSVPRHGAGVWAPALRHHGGKFRLYYPDPDFGLYVVTADNPRNAWSDPIMVKPGRGLIDPCPFWDDDGTGYLIHGWANSRSGTKNRLTLHRLGPDQASVIDAGEILIDGDVIPGWHTLEGPKLYKRAGYYYIFAPAGGVRDGYQAVFRSRQLRGPYEHRIVLAQGNTPINGPHQGAWIETPEGEHWFLHFQERPAFGRVVHLQPMIWRDNWPVVGQRVDANGTGEPVLTHRRPNTKANPTSEAANGHSIPALVPGPEWQWQANPQPEWFSMSADEQTWRLACVALPATASLWQAGHLLMRKFVGPAFTATVTLGLRPRAEGDRAGLVIFGRDYAWLGLRQERGKIILCLHTCSGANRGGMERVIAAWEWKGDSVQLRVSVDELARCEFSFGADGNLFAPVGSIFQATSSDWVGAKVGVFASAEGKGQSGHAEISDFVMRTLESNADCLQ